MNLPIKRRALPALCAVERRAHHAIGRRGDTGVLSDTNNVGLVTKRNASDACAADFSRQLPEPDGAPSMR